MIVDDLSFRPTQPGFIFDGMILREPDELAVAPAVTARVADMRKMELVVANAADRERRADPHHGADYRARVVDDLIRLLDDRSQIRQVSIAGALSLRGNFLDRALGRFRAARQAAHAVRHAKEHRDLIVQKAVFVFLRTRPMSVSAAERMSVIEGET